MTRGIHRYLGGLRSPARRPAALAAERPQAQSQERTAFANYARSVKAGASAKLGRTSAIAGACRGLAGAIERSRPVRVRPAGCRV